LNNAALVETGVSLVSFSIALIGCIAASLYAVTLKLHYILTGPAMKFNTSAPGGEREVGRNPEVGRGGLDKPI